MTSNKNRLKAVFIAITMGRPIVMAYLALDQRLAGELEMYTAQNEPDDDVCCWCAQNRNPDMGSSHVFSFQFYM